MSTTDLEPDNEPTPHRQRWQDELEEILASSDLEAKPVDKVRGKVVSARYSAPATGRSIVERFRESWSPGMWIILFVLLLLLTVVVQHYSPLLGRILAMITVVALIAIIARGFLRSRHNGPNPANMWRGRDMSTKPENRSWFDKIFGKRD